jgi:hypothetical protein
MHENIKYDFIDFFFNYLILYIPQGTEFRHSYFFTTVLVRLTLHITVFHTKNMIARARTHTYTHIHTQVFTSRVPLCVCPSFHFKKVTFACQNNVKTSSRLLKQSPN